MKTSFQSQAIALALSCGLAACGSGTSNPAVPVDGEVRNVGECALRLPPQGFEYPMSEVPCDQREDERVLAMSNGGIQLTSSLGLPKGRYALPPNANPSQLVVFFHGHQNDSCSWRNHMREVAARGGIAVAMDYSDQEDRVVEPYGLVENWGWAVRSGAADSVLAAQFFMAKYPSISQVHNFGASMGGNVSGYAAYFDGAVRADCSPMWDYWVAAEGVHQVTQEYNGARALAPTRDDAAQFVQEIEEENGGTLEEVPDRYAEITNTLHAGDLAYLKGAVLTHGTEDATVPVNQSREMADQLRAAGVPTHLYLVSGAGHAWEGNGDLKVMSVALEELYRLMQDGEEVTDGETPVEGP